MMNVMLTVMTIFPSALLLYRMLLNKTRDKVIQYLLIFVFASILVSSILSTHISLMLISGSPASEILLEANIRNLIKNLAICTMAWTFLYIEEVK